MKKVMLMIIAVLLVVTSSPVNATVINYEDGSFELSELIITEVASSNSQVPISDCPAASGDFIELYASEDVYLLNYQLIVKSSNGEREIALPDVEITAGDVVLLGCVNENENENKKDINLINSSGYVRIIKKSIDAGPEQEIDRVDYSRMETEDSYERDICANDFILSEELSPGIFNADIECEPSPEPEPEPEAPQYCDAIKLSEVSVNEQWIELYNTSEQAILPANLTSCHLLVQQGETLEFDDYNLLLSELPGFQPYEYYVVDITTSNELSLPKSKDRTIMIYDEDGAYMDKMIYSTHKTETSWARFNNDWQVTHTPTKGGVNVFQKYQTCEAGQHINEATGNCVKDPELPTECAAGYFRNPATGRCKKIATANELTECAEGYFRNPLTNRCKKIASEEDELKPCAEGWERNPETNRCRKKVSTEPAAFAVQPGNPTGGSMTALFISVGVVMLTTSIVLFQFRMEIANLARRLIPKRVKINT